MPYGNERKGPDNMQFTRTTRLRTMLVAAFAGLVSASSGIAGTADTDGRTIAELTPAAIAANPSAFKICPESPDDPNTFALCATAKCWTLDGVAYCKCDVLNEDSISLPFHFRAGGKRQDVCDLLKEGVENGFTISTYATPRQLEKDYKPAKEKLGRPLALYTCPGTSMGAEAGYSAQCDGGVCFKSTVGQDFPGLGHVKKDEIVCSCPPAAASPIGFQASGPWSCRPGAKNVNGRCCDQDYQERLCGVTSVSKTGTRIAVGAPTGVATVLSKLLDGKAPAINRCVFQ
ncbi:hypothetical protein [Microbaculum marinum]|uniref:Thyroglobulin type-1 domain-containing protein n=1 Tax=Microbaculum marinum TaxID=1764581 RepID=A0AAW9S420_9HYPH